ncbi:hypothetical protein EI94DRAFT_1720612 [Lactarius quietus]|nr:hypothetical protein EI94DRAFT_1720612 [Lactarius quietus]
MAPKGETCEEVTKRRSLTRGEISPELFIQIARTQLITGVERPDVRSMRSRRDNNATYGGFGSEGVMTRAKQL